MTGQSKRQGVKSTSESRRHVSIKEHVKRDILQGKNEEACDEKYYAGRK